MANMGIPGVAGYVGLPVGAGVLTLPLFIRSWWQPALRIDTIGISRMRRHRVETANWEILDAVQFTGNQRVLVLTLRAGATFSGKRCALSCPAPMPYYTLGNTLRRRQHRRDHDLIVIALEHFAPGIYSDEPFRIRKGHTAAGSNQPSP
jgi:hypothetical protein